MASDNLQTYTLLTRNDHRFVWTTRMKRHVFGLNLRTPKNETAGDHLFRSVPAQAK